MQIKFFLFSIVLFVIFSQSASACCIGEQSTLTEVLMSKNDKRSIFLCTVDSTYIGGISGGAHSFATVNEVFRGEKVPKQVIVASGGNTSAGGHSLKIGQQYLIFSSSHNDYLYNAFVCDAFSMEVNHLKSSSAQNQKNHNLFSLIKQYFEWQKNDFTGKVELISGEVIMAKGVFLNGKPDGTWTHFRYKNYLKKEMEISSQVNFKNGELDGWCKFIPNQDRGNGSSQYYKNGKLISSEFYQINENIAYLAHKVIYKERNKQIIRYLPDGEKIEDFNCTTITIPYLRGMREMCFKNGFSYAHKKETNLIESGNYYQGRKIGTWTFYDKKTDMETTETFEFEMPELDYFIAYHPNGQKAHEGQIIKGKPEGLWINYFENGNIKAKISCKNGVLHGSYLHFRQEDGTMWKEDWYENGEVVPQLKTYYLPDSIISFEKLINEDTKVTIHKSYRKDGQLSEIKHFKNEKPHGWHYRFSMRGDTTLAQEYFKGYLNGYSSKVLAHAIKEVGQYRFGCKVGAWKTFDRRGILVSICQFQNIEKDNFQEQNFSDNCIYFDKTGQEVSTEKYWQLKKQEHNRKQK